MNLHRSILFLCAWLFCAPAVRAQKPGVPSVRPALVAQLGHSSFVQSVRFSPDGKTLASGSPDRTVILWNAATGKELRTLFGHGDDTAPVCFSPDGKTLASGDGTIWDAATGRELCTLAGQERRVHIIGFSPDGKTLAGWPDRDTIKLWDAATGRELRTLSGLKGSVCFSPDGKTLASTGDDTTLRLWDVASGRELHTLSGHIDHAVDVCFSPDGKTLASWGLDKTVRLWDTATGRELRTLSGHEDRVESVCFSPDGKTLASREWGGTVKLWNTATGSELHTLSGHNGLVCFSPDGKILATTSDDKTVKLWDAASGNELHTLSGHTGNINSVNFSPDGKTLASGSDDHTIKLWDAATGRELRNLSGHTYPVPSVSFSPDGKTLAGGSWKAINLWNTTTGKELRTLFGHGDDIAPVCFSPDGKTLASGDGTIWDAATGRELRTLSGLKGSVCFSPDGKTLASTGDDTTLRLWDTASGRELRTLAGQGGTVQSVCFSPDGKTLAYGSEDGAVRLWDTATGRELRTLPRDDSYPYESDVLSVCFSPDGKMIASGSMDPSVRLWDAASGKELHALRGHTGEVNSVCFSPDGKILASGSDDNTIKLWDTASGRELHTLSGHAGSVMSVSFSSDGKTLASGGWDGTVRLWDTASGREICSLIGFDDGTWAVTDPEGRYDASNGGNVEGLHWVMGNEPIALGQLKERYYEPGLLAKILQGKPLRPVAAFDNVPLYPEVRTERLDDKHLKVHLADQGGGIGRVQVYVNDALFLEDARPAGTDPNAKELTFTVDVSRAPTLKPGKENDIRVVAYNAENWLPSRGIRLAVTPPGEAQNVPRRLFAIVCGISDYAAPDLRLGFPAMDAVRFAQALRLGAERAKPVIAGYDIALLTTADAPGALPPTKANLERAFAHVREKAKPDDILVVYLAGHGIALSTDNSLYCYLTQEANSADTAKLAADPVLRRQTTITSAELADWINRIPATYRVMALDTCAAGAAEAKLTEKRDAPGDQIRAMERFKDRTGFHILMGCAADRVSYEASRYGQGVLTYALLQGMKGAALREGEWVDVRTLFSYAEDEVPKLAGDIGGIQQPRYQKPGAGSFDIGKLTPDDRAAIPLASARPQVLRPKLGNKVDGVDDLELEKLLRQRLLDAFYASTRGSGGAPSSPVFYVDAEELSGAIRPIGQYTVEGKKVTVTITLLRDRQRVGTLTIEGSKDDPAGLAAKMAQAIVEAVGKLGF
jgi:WD40 repeat protein